MGIKEDILRDLQNKKMLEAYISNKQQLNNNSENNKAIQQGIQNNNTANASKGLTGNSVANQGIDKGMQVVGMLGPWGAAANAVYQIGKGLFNVQQTKEQNNMIRDQRHNIQDHQENLNDYTRLHNDLDNNSNEALQRMQAQEKANIAQTLNDKLTAGLMPQTGEQFDEKAEQKNKELIANSEANLKAEQQAAESEKQAIMDAVKNSAQSVASAYTQMSDAKGADAAMNKPQMNTDAKIVGVDNGGYMGNLPNLDNSVNPNQVDLSSTNYQTNINTPNTMQTPQNAQSIPTQIGYVAPEEYNNQDEGQSTGYAANYQPALSRSGSASDYIGQGDEYDKAVEKYNKANEGEKTKLDIMNGLRDFYAGYQDNRDNGFTKGDFFKENFTPSQNEDGSLTGGASDVKKDIMQRVGEVAGTGARVLSNPLTQAGVAGIVTAATGGNSADVANNMVKYGFNKAKSDYYADQLGVPRGILGNYTKDDYNAKTMRAYRDAMVQNNSKRVTSQTYNNYLKYLDAQLTNGEISPEDHQLAKQEVIKQMVNNGLIMDEVPVGTSQVSNNTRKTDAQLEHWDNQDNVAQEKADTDAKYKNTIGGVAVTNANTNAGRAKETARHNKVTEGQNGKKINDSKNNNDTKNNIAKAKIQLEIIDKQEKQELELAPNITAIQAIQNKYATKRQQLLNVINGTNSTQKTHKTNAF